MGPKFKIGDRVNGSVYGPGHELARNGTIRSCPVKPDSYYDVVEDSGQVWLLRANELTKIENGLDVMFREAFGD